MSAMQQHAAALPRPLPLPAPQRQPRPEPAKRTKPRKVKTTRGKIDGARKPKTEDSPRSAFDPFKVGYTAVPHVYVVNVCPQLTKGENDMMLAFMRLSWGRKRKAGDPLPHETEPMTVTQLAKEAGLDRRTADFTLEVLLSFGLLGRGGKAGTTYRFWPRAENWAGWKRPVIEAKTAEADEAEDVTEEVAGEDKENANGNRLPFFDSPLVLKCGARTKPIRFEPAVKEQVQELFYRSSCQSPLSIEHAIEGGRLIVSICDAEPLVSSPKPKTEASELSEIRRLLNSLLNDNHLMEPASDVLCSQVLHLRGHATLKDIELKIAAAAARAKAKKGGYITPGLVLAMVKECATAAKEAHSQAQADEAHRNLRQRKTDDARAEREALDREYMEGDEEHRAKMREAGYRF